MIRLNDKYKTVIDEKEIKGYSAFTVGFYERDEYKEGERICLYTGNISMKADYETKEVRDKDIELLDKIFDVKSIEDKAMSVEKPELYSNKGINEESKPTKEEYITWDYLKECGQSKIKLPNGDVENIYYDNVRKIIWIENDCKTRVDARIYSEDLFNALKLKKVE